MLNTGTYVQYLIRTAKGFVGVDHAGNETFEADESNATVYTTREGATSAMIRSGGWVVER